MRRRRCPWVDNLRFSAQSLTDLYGSYDLILCIDVLEHIVEDQVALNTLEHALSGSGVLVLHIPQRRDLNHFVLSQLGDGYVHDHVRYEYTEQEIEGKIDRAGLRIEKKRYTFGWPGSLARELYYRFERHSGLSRVSYRSTVFPLSLLLAMLDTITPNDSHQGFLYRLSRTGRAESRRGDD